VWDIYNNSTTATTDFIVAESVEMAIDELVNYPNPFKNHTTFSFEHNQTEQPLDITIYIYALDGRLVTALNDIYYAGGYRYNSVVWDGTDAQGNKLQKGMYIYKVLVQNFDGSVQEKTSKLVIMK
jgi:flagellar hook assembly protein FlgD